MRQPGSMEVDAVHTRLEPTGRKAPEATITEITNGTSFSGAVQHRPETTHA